MSGRRNRPRPVPSRSGLYRKRGDFRIVRVPESRRAQTDSVSDVAGSQVPVMLFDHPRVGVTQVLRHHQQRHAIHDCVAGPSVPQRMEIDRRVDLGVLTRLRCRRSWCDARHVSPLALRNMISLSARPAVSCWKKKTPSSVSTT